MKESHSPAERLFLPKPCPKEGIWLPGERFYYQHPSVFAELFGPGKRGFEELEHFARSPLTALGWPSALCVEFCSGNGTWIEQRARAAPDLHWIAVEQRLDRARKIWLRKKRLGLTNVTVACAEGSLFCQMHLPPKSIAHCFVNFPDPWPKKRHAKHRLLKRSFLRQLSATLSPNGDLFIATDDVQSLVQLELMLQQEGSFASKTQRYLPHQPFGEYGTSYFESLWRSKGKTLFLVRCRLKADLELAIEKDEEMIFGRAQ